LPESVDALNQMLVKNGFDDSATLRALKALNAAAARGVFPRDHLEEIVQFVRDHNDDIRAETIRLIGDWNGVAKIKIDLTSFLKPSAATEVRDAVFAAMRKIGGETTVHKLQTFAKNGTPQEIRQPAVLTLAALDTAHCGSNVVSLLTSLGSSEAALPMWRDLLQISGIRPVLLAALPHQGFPTAVGQAGLRAVRELGRPEPDLVVALTRAAGLHGGETTLTAAEIKKLGEMALKSGDPIRGERIFRSPQQSCVTCHSIGGVGGKVGPDLTSVGTSSPIDYLVESVLYPNKEIKDGFQAYLIETTDGEELSGIPVRENDRELVLRTAGDQDVVVSKKEIKSKKPGGSLMPSGLVDNLSSQEQMDLYRFLSELGKPGRFDASKANVARLWMVAADPTNSGDEENLVRGNLTGNTWHRVSALVDGQLLPKDLASAVPGASDMLLAGARFRIAKAGAVHFDLSAPEGACLWIDGGPVPYAKSVSRDLPAGNHTIILKVEDNNLAEPIRLHSDDGTFVVEAH
jgi:putative heme-binding domain-containing protein